MKKLLIVLLVATSFESFAVGVQSTSHTGTTCTWICEPSTPGGHGLSGFGDALTEAACKVKAETKCGNEGVASYSYKPKRFQGVKK